MNIEHVIVLMLENRSYDHMLLYLWVVEMAVSGRKRATLKQARPAGAP